MANRRKQERRAKSSEVPGTGIELVPIEVLSAIGNIYQEGVKYGRDNWRKGAWDIEWLWDRHGHAERHHLAWKAPHLAKKFTGEDKDMDTADHFAKYVWWLSVLFAFRDDPEFAGSPGQYLAIHGHLRGYPPEEDIE